MIVVFVMDILIVPLHSFLEFCIDRIFDPWKAEDRKEWCDVIMAAANLNCIEAYVYLLKVLGHVPDWNFREDSLIIVPP